MLFCADYSGGITETGAQPLINFTCIKRWFASKIVYISMSLLSGWGFAGKNGRKKVGPMTQGAGR